LIRQIVQDFTTLEDSKIIQDDGKFLLVKALIASEIVHKYKDGTAYKPAYELEKPRGLLRADGKIPKSPVALK
jgi:hypothetical protein